MPTSSHAPRRPHPIRRSAAIAGLTLLGLAFGAMAQPLRPGAAPLAAPSAGQQPAAGAPRLVVSGAEKAAVRVGDAVIRKGRIDSLAALMALARGADIAELPPAQATTLRRAVATRLIGQELLDQEAKAKNVRATPREIDSGLAELKSQFPDAASWQRTLRQNGDTEADVRARIARQIRLDRVLATALKQPTPPTDAELRAFWEENKSEFPVNDSLRALQIVLLANPQAPAPDSLEKKRRLTRLRADLAADSADVETLIGRFMNEAGRIGEGPEARRGGDMGRFHPDDFHAAFRNNVRGLDVGGLSPVFRTPMGYHLVLLVEKFDGRFESYRLQSIQNLTIRKNMELERDMRKFLKKLAETHTVTYLLPDYKDSSESGID